MVREVWSIDGETCVPLLQKIVLYVRGRDISLETETKTREGRYDYFGRGLGRDGVRREREKRTIMAIIILNQEKKRY